MTAPTLQLLVLFALFFSVMGRSQPAFAVADLLTEEVDSYKYCDRDYSCIDCTTARICAPTPDGKNLYETSRFSCSSTYPYCNFTSGSCSSYIDPVCSQNYTISQNFTCMRDGYFPDPYNCSIYYQCVNETAYQYTCAYPYSYYAPQYQSCYSYRYYCTNYTTTSDCSYSSYVGRKDGISYTNNYFLNYGNHTVAAVDKCIGAYIFDSSSQMCLPNCPREGLFLNNTDCTKYYKCSPKSSFPGSSLVMTADMTCPEGQGFLESEYMCVNKSRVPNCYDQYPDLFSK